MSVGLNSSWMALSSSTCTEFNRVWTQVSGSPGKNARDPTFMCDCSFFLFPFLSLWNCSLIPFSAVRELPAVYLWKDHISMLSSIRFVAFTSLTVPAANLEMVSAFGPILNWGSYFGKGRLKTLNGLLVFQISFAIKPLGNDVIVSRHRRGRSSRLISGW